MKSGSEQNQRFVRCRFTLTQEVNSVLDDLAEEHHAGNRSACVREAIYAMDRRGNEDELRHGLKRLRKEIAALAEQVESIEATTASGEVQKDDTDQGLPPVSQDGDSDSAPDTDSSAKIARKLYRIIQEKQQSEFHLEDLLAEVDYALSSVAIGLERLVEQGVLEKVDTEDRPQYKIVHS